MGRSSCSNKVKPFPLFIFHHSFALEKTYFILYTSLTVTIRREILLCRDPVSVPKYQISVSDIEFKDS